MAWDLSAVPLACFALIVRKQPVVECPKTKTFIEKGKDHILDFGWGIKVVVV